MVLMKTMKILVGAYPGEERVKLIQKVHEHQKLFGVRDVSDMPEDEMNRIDEGLLARRHSGNASAEFSTWMRDYEQQLNPTVYQSKKSMKEDMVDAITQTNELTFDADSPLLNVSFINKLYKPIGDKYKCIYKFVADLLDVDVVKLTKAVVTYHIQVLITTRNTFINYRESWLMIVFGANPNGLPKISRLVKILNDEERDMLDICLLANFLQTTFILNAAGERAIKIFGGQTLTKPILIRIERDRSFRLMKIKYPDFKLSINEVMIAAEREPFEWQAFTRLVTPTDEHPERINNMIFAHVLMRQWAWCQANERQLGEYDLTVLRALRNMTEECLEHRLQALVDGALTPNIHDWFGRQIFVVDENNDCFAHVDCELLSTETVGLRREVDNRYSFFKFNDERVAEVIDEKLQTMNLC